LRIFLPAKVAQALVYSYISYILLQSVGETIFLTFMLIAAVAACTRFEPRPLLPEDITFNFASRTIDIAILESFFAYEKIT
jgi:hypothetical protein